MWRCKLGGAAPGPSTERACVESHLEVNLSHRSNGLRVAHNRAVSDLRLEYSKALSSFDVNGIVGLMTDDVTIRVAVHDETMHGRDTAEFLFGVLSEELGSMYVTKEIVEGDRAVVLFETELRGTRAQGLNVVESSAGQIHDLTVFFRPLSALQLVAQVIGARMAERFGALEEDQGR